MKGINVVTFTEYDRATHLPARSQIDWYFKVKSTEEIRPGVLQCKLIRRLDLPPVGGTLLLRYGINGFETFFIDRGHDFTFDNVTIYSSASYGLLGYYSRNFHLNRFNVMLKPGSGRWMSANADATHFRQCTGEVDMQDCLFEANGDDATNIHGTFQWVRQIVDDHTLVTSGRDSRMPEGDTVDFSHPDLLIYGSALVTKETIDPKTHLVTAVFDKPLPKEIQVGDVVDLASRQPKTRIRHCTVRANRGRGFLLSGRDTICEDCTFDHCCAAGIQVTCDLMSYQESGQVRDSIIRNNHFSGDNYGVASREADINVIADLPGLKPAPAGVHQHIVIEGNTIENTPHCGIHVSSASDVVIRNNRITNCCQEDIPQGSAAIRLVNVTNYRLSGNKISDINKAAKPILIGSVDKPHIEIAVAWLANVPMDGSLDAWKGVAPLVVSGKSSVFQGQEFWKGDADASYSIRSATDGSQLFIAIEVADDDIAGGGTDPVVCMNDAVEVLWDARPVKQRNGQRGPGTGQIILVAPTQGDQLFAKVDAEKEPIKSALKTAFRRTATGYIVELALPFTAMGYAGKASRGDTIGLQVQMDDRDETGGTVTNKFLSIGGAPGAYQDTSTYATATFQ